MTVNDIIVLSSQEILNFADDPQIKHWITIMYVGDKAFKTMDNYVCRRFRWVCLCALLHSRRWDWLVGHNVNVVTQPSELRSEAIDVSLNPANTRRIAISQQAYSQFWHLNSISASYLQALPGHRLCLDSSHDHNDGQCRQE